MLPLALVFTLWARDFAPLAGADFVPLAAGFAGEVSFIDASWVEIFEEKGSLSRQNSAVGA